MRSREYLRLKVDYYGGWSIAEPVEYFYIFIFLFGARDLSVRTGTPANNDNRPPPRHTPLHPYDAPSHTPRPTPYAPRLSPMGVPRIPYTLPFPPPKIRPSNAITLSAATAAIADFLQSRNTVFLTGAGISVESGLADYRGEKGTYRLNQKYRPIFFDEFVGNHESRKRYVLPRRTHDRPANWLQVLGEELHRVAVDRKGTAKQNPRSRITALGTRPCVACYNTEYKNTLFPPQETDPANCQISRRRFPPPYLPPNPADHRASRDPARFNMSHLPHPLPTYQVPTDPCLSEPQMGRLPENHFRGRRLRQQQ